MIEQTYAFHERWKSRYGKFFTSCLLTAFTCILSCIPFSQAPEQPGTYHIPIPPHKTVKLSWRLIADSTGADLWYKHTSIVFHDSIFSFIGGTVDYNSDGYPASDTRDVYATADGMTWFPMLTSSSSLIRESPVAIFFKEQLWLIGGYNDWTSCPTLFSSDGKEWVSAGSTPSNLSHRRDHAVVVHQDRIIVTGGVGKYADDFWPWLSSSDGTNWDTLSGTPDIQGHTMLSYHDKLFVIAGRWRFEPSDNVLCSTNNGTSWSNIGLAGLETFSPRYDHSSIVYQDLMWIIGGVTRPVDNPSAAVKTNDCWFSEDGTYWYEAPQTDSLPPMAGHSSVVFDNRIWVMNGNQVWCGEAFSSNATGSQMTDR